MTALRPWQAQQIFGTTANEIKAPESISVAPKTGEFRISWHKRLGRVDGFIILVGNSPRELQDHMTIFQNDKSEYSADVKALINGREYFTSVVAFRGDRRSEIPEVWKVIPNVAGMYRPAEKVSTEVLIPAEASREVQNAREEIAIAQEVIVGPVAAEVPRQQVENVAAAICAACAGDVFLDEDLQVFKCSGCGAQYVQRVIDDKFIAVNILANGICMCCQPKRPLIQPQGEQYKKCSLSGESYVELEGGLMMLSQLDYGLCTCCRPHHPLILNGQGQVVCSTKRENLYVREGNRFMLRLPDAPPSLLNDIDRALANGSAVMMPNGILTSGDGQPRNTRRQT